jgi:hypothetical protein
MASYRPANGLGSNGFNGLGFQVGALWMGGNGLIYLAGRVGFNRKLGWMGWDWVLFLWV